MIKLYLQKNEKGIEKNKELGEDKMPYFRLVIPPEKEGGEWIDAGAFWKSKSGKGYNGRLSENVEITIIKKSGEVKED